MVPTSQSDAVNNTLNACAIVAGVGQYSTVSSSGDMWRGRNGNWNRMSWPGNQHTGARSVAVTQANSLRTLGRASFGLGTAVSGYQGFQAYQQGDTSGAVKSGADIVMGGVGTFGGPKGLIVSGVLALMQRLAGVIFSRCAKRKLGAIGLEMGCPIWLTR